jgi:3'-phosphoadenosine 5'-phosphosulfate sulfotransferase (PAPS reductase)/FAD synthetase
MNVQVGFSGGRTSGMMLARLAAQPGALDAARVVFANTGREMPETLDFVRDVGVHFGIAIDWVEYTPERPWFRLVSHETAARNGEPFEALIRKRKYLPNQQARFCTSDLKIKPAKRFLKSLGWRNWTNYVGIRADEAHRAKQPQNEPWQNAFPLIDAQISKADVMQFWRQQPFDLRLPSVEGKTPLGNCDGCFLKSERFIAALSRDMPERAAWWERMEAETGGSWSKRYTRQGTREFVTAQGDWIFDDASALCQADGGECVV